MTSVMCVAFCSFFATEPIAEARSTSLERLDRIWDGFESSLVELAAKYEEIGLTADANRLRTDITRGLNAVDYNPPRRVLSTLAETIPVAAASIWRRERQLRSEYALAVYRQARAALVDGQTALGMRLLRHALAIDSDAATVRRILGYEQVDGVWKTTFEALMEKRGNVWHDDFGWLPEDHVARYDAGERYFRNRWMTQLEEAEMRKRFEFAWTVETEHFSIKTNVSQEAAAALAKRLETFRDYFYREFAPLFDSRQAARELLKPEARRQTKKHTVHYFSSREEYVRTLLPKQRGVAISRGVYLPRDRVSYFFHDPEVSDPLDTVYHEVTHQLLFESDPRMRDVAADGGYWAVEGLACYFESFRDEEEAARTGRPVAGDVDHERIYWARHRVLVEGYYLPLEQFDRLGMRLFQAAPNQDDLRRRYSQSTGLTHFLIHYDNGRYRDGFLEYLTRLYASSATSRRGLQTILGVPYQLLDRQYRDHLAMIEAEAKVASIPDLD